MTVSFKQFSTFLDQAEGEHSPEKLDEIWDKILGKRKEDEDKKDKRELTAQEKKAKGLVLTAKDRLELQKDEAEKRKKMLKKHQDEVFARSKERAEGPAPRHGKSDRDDYALHRSMKEEKSLRKTSYSDESYWKDDAKEAGYKVKKLSGDLMKGDQTWGAFDGDKKMGEFTEKEEGRGGWLVS